MTNCCLHKSHRVCVADPVLKLTSDDPSHIMDERTKKEADVMFCTRCGLCLPDTAHFCTRCGAPVAPVYQQPTPMNQPAYNPAPQYQPVYYAPGPAPAYPPSPVYQQPVYPQTPGYYPMPVYQQPPVCPVLPASAPIPTPAPIPEPVPDSAGESVPESSL